MEWDNGSRTSAGEFAVFWMDQFGVRHFTCDDPRRWAHLFTTIAAHHPLSFDESPRDRE